MTATTLKLHYNNTMSDSRDFEQPAATAASTEFPEAEQDNPRKRFSDVAKPRIFLRKSAVRALARIGVEDDVSAVTTAVNAIVEHYAAYRIMEIPTMVDLLAVEQDLSCRLRELTVANLGITKLLTDIGATTEYRGVIHSFRRLVEEAKAKNQKKP